MPLGSLLVLGLAAFMSVTIEMLPTGLMHLMAPDLGVSEPEIGYLMTAFSLAVIITSTPLTRLLRRVPRHSLLVGVLAVYCVASLVTAIADTYALVLASRILGGVAHGIFWAIVASYVALITPKRHLAHGISITLGGASVAFVLGLPLCTALGQMMGWRPTVVTLVACTFATAIALWLVLPRVNHLDEALHTAPVELPGAGEGEKQARNASRPLPAFAVRPKSFAAVLLISGLTAIIMIAEYGFYSYITPYLRGPLGVPAASLSLMLFGYGILTAIATALTGVLFGRRRRVGIVTALAAMLVVGIVMRWLAPGAAAWTIAGLMLWGFAMGFLPPLLQTELLEASPSRMRDVASALYSSCFNIGIGGGALIGGQLMEHAGLVALPVFFVIVVGGALVAFAVVVTLLQRGRPGAHPPATAPAG